MGTVPRFAGKYQADVSFDDLDVEVAVACRLPAGWEGPRELLAALVRVPGQEARWVEGWRSDEFALDPTDLWAYLDEGGWSNGYTTEVQWFKIARVEDAPVVLEHLATVLAVHQPAHGRMSDAPVAVGSPADQGAGTGSLSIHREEPPSWLTLSESSESDQVWSDIAGEQPEWGYAIPQMHRVLASPYAGHPLLRAPAAGDGTAVAASYWSALLHLLVYSLGWVRPDRGIHAWQLAGRPTDDLTLQLLSEVWLADGMLDWFQAWACRKPTQQTTDRLAELIGFDQDDDDPPCPRDWVQHQQVLADQSGVPAPCGTGGWDPLHLSAHLEGPIEAPPGRVSLVDTTTPRRQVVLLVDSMTGWYRALCSAGAALPHDDGCSWRIEVVVRTVGSLGRFRRSRATGLWFTGRHRHHMLGSGGTSPQATPGR